jgi:uncharacterized membrane protein
MRRRVPLVGRTSADDVRTTLWFFPAVAATLSGGLALALLQVRPGPSWAWPGSTDSATSLLQGVATAVMTATTLTFSLTVVALQLASQQFSPRLLREFARDRATQATLGVLVSTFVVSLTGLRGVDDEQPLPRLLVGLSFVLGLASAMTLLAFVGHLVRALRVDTMMVAVHKEAARVVDETYPPFGDDGRAPPDDLPTEGGHLVPLRRSGFVRTLDPQRLVDVARAHDLLVVLAVRPGDAVVRGTPLARVWAGGEEDVDQLGDELLTGVELGFERTSEQDAALGLRQLTDIAVKAISPGINDPVTAVIAIGYCADLVVRMQERRLGPQAHRDADGVLRVVTPDRDIRYYLDLVCAPVRRYGRSEPLVLNGLLRLLRDAAVTARSAEQRAAIRQQVDLVLEEVDEGLLEHDAGTVRDLARRVGLVLQGDVAAAYEDRSGETRSA